MSEDQKDIPTESASAIQIVRLIDDKTRKDNDSDDVYHVCFELSGYPPTEWRNIFERDWKALNESRRVSIDGMFLVVHCRLDEVAPTQLPALKKVVATTNEAYRQYAQKEATALQHREAAWKQERKDVDSMGALLRFDQKP